MVKIQRMDSDHHGETAILSRMERMRWKVSLCRMSQKTIFFYCKKSRRNAKSWWSDFVSWVMEDGGLWFLLHVPPFSNLSKYLVYNYHWHLLHHCYYHWHLLHHWSSQRRRQRKMMCISRRVAAFFCFSLFLRSCFSAVEQKETGESDKKHRIFPAAESEAYSNDNGIVGFLRPQNLTFRGCDFCLHGNQVIGPAIQQFRRSLYRVPDFLEDYKENPNGYDLFHMSSVDIQIHSSSTELFHGVDESYSLKFDDESPTVILQANTIFGARHAFETLAQLLEFGWMDGKEPIYLIQSIPLTIVDGPSYSYRGLLIDTARHYLTLPLILDTLFAMSMNKMNVLHWHMVDDQSFPYQSTTYPEIAQKGAYHPRRIYTSNDIQRVISEAFKLGIRVIPEVDMPGHTRAIGKSHPEFMAFCPDPGSVLDATKTQVYDFVDNVYRDLNALFPDSMVHVGGDEVQLNCWSESESIAKWMKAHNITDAVELYEYFETKLLRIVDTKYKKIPIVWQEVFNLNLTITPATIVDVWKGFDIATIEAAAARNFRMILSGCWYLDHLDKNWKNFYECDPRNFTGNRDLMIGGHASMWGEHVDATNIVSRIWPRASAAAERLWTGNVTIAQKNVEDRIHKFRCRMVQQGIAAAPTVGHGGFCPHEPPYLAEYRNIASFIRGNERSSSIQ